MAGGRKPSVDLGGDAGKHQRLAEMAAAESIEAPDLLSADDAPQMEHEPWLPEPSPITPLGHFGGKIVFLDSSQQVVITGTDCKKGDLKLWGDNEYWLKHFEQIGRGDKPTGKFDQDDVQTALVQACKARGIFNPQGKVLGRGAHSPEGADDTLVLHMGRAVLIAEPGREVRLERPGRVMVAGKELFFPADAALVGPAKEPATRKEAEALLHKLNGWNWTSPSVRIGPELETSAEALLLLGLIAQAYICGALGWRSHAWLAAPTGAGKTELQKLFRAVLDEWVVKTADASEAGIRQVLRNDTLAVSVDEAEKADNPERQKAMLNLIKKSSSGDIIIRGSADHRAQEFTAQSCFLMSSVLHATFKGEDRNRIALLQLRPLPEDVGEFDPQLPHWRKVGRRLHRRMVEQWPRYERTLAAYRQGIAKQRFDGRWQDTYGNLLACADLLLHDFVPDSLDLDGTGDGDRGRVDAAVAAILPLLVKGRAEAKTDTEGAILHLMGMPLPGAGGDPPEPVGRWLDRAMTAVADESGLEGPNEKARERLKSVGLAVKQFFTEGEGKAAKRVLRDAQTGENGWKLGYLAIAYSTNPALQQLWRGTDWSGDGYIQSLKKVNGCDTKKVRFHSQGSENALLVPLEAFMGEEG